MKKRLVVLIAFAAALYWYWLQSQAQPEEQAVPAITILPRRKKRTFWRVVAFVAAAVFLFVIGLVIPHISPRATLVPIVQEVAARVCSEGFSACPFSVIIEAIRTAEAGGETVPCTIKTSGETEYPDNTDDPACHLWLFGTQR